MDYAQSINQAFYFVEDVLIDGSSIETGSWILAYNNNVLVGARQWQGKFMDVPAMAYDNSYQTAGYLLSGDRVRLELLDLDGNQYILSGDIPVWENNEIFHTGVLSNVNIPDEISISSVYPNPFNPTTNIEFGLTDKAGINISIYDINGRFVELLADDQFSRGFHEISWDASGYPSGIYFVKMTSGDSSIAQKLILMK